MITVNEFLVEVCRPNRDAVMQEPSNYRHAINAVLCLDAFFGFFVSDGGEIEGRTFDQDHKLRDWVANQSVAYHVLRDCAFSLKHGDLTSKARIVKSKNAVGVSEARWNDDGYWDDELVWSDDLVFISLPGSILAENGLAETNNSIRLDVIVREVFRICTSFANGQNPEHKDLVTLLRMDVFN